MLGEASKINLNIKQKYGVSITASESMDPIKKYNEAPASIDY